MLAAYICWKLASSVIKNVENVKHCEKGTSVVIWLKPQWEDLLRNGFEDNQENPPNGTKNMIWKFGAFTDVTS